MHSSRFVDIINHRNTVGIYDYVIINLSEYEMAVYTL